MDDYAKVVRVTSLDDGLFDMVHETVSLSRCASQVVVGVLEGDWVWDVTIVLGGIECFNVRRTTCSAPLRIVSYPWGSFGDASDAIVHSNVLLNELIEGLDTL